MSRQERLIKHARALQRHNPATVGIWGVWGVLWPLRAGDIRPVPLTGLRLWIRRGEFRLFRIHEFDLVD